MIDGSRHHGHLHLLCNQWSLNSKATGSVATVTYMMILDRNSGSSLLMNTSSLIYLQVLCSLMSTDLLLKVY